MLYEKPKETPQVQNLPCYYNFAVSEKVMLYPTEKTCIELGTKIFHCVRRFTSTAMPDCKKCIKDMNKECFVISKQYYSPELVTLLIKEYTRRAFICDGGSQIFWNDRCLPEMMAEIAKIPVTYKEEREQW